jgi:ABC-type sugar transport system ATPase subunit
MALVALSFAAIFIVEKTEVKQAMSFLLLRDRHMDPGEFSLHRGEQLRTTMARALAAKDRGITVVHITHDLDDVWALADKVAGLRGGRLIQHDTLRMAFHRPPISEDCLVSSNG